MLTVWPPSERRSTRRTAATTLELGGGAGRRHVQQFRPPVDTKSVCVSQSKRTGVDGTMCPHRLPRAGGSLAAGHEQPGLRSAGLTGPT